MGSIHDTRGVAVPFLVDDFNVEDLTLGAFDPITDLHDADNVAPDEMSEERAMAKYHKNGFLVRPETTGDLYVVTWRQLENAMRGEETRANIVTILAGLVPKAYDGVAHQWCEVPVVKVFGTDGDGSGHYESASDNVRIGIIL
jgi:hypothetical protein